MYLRTTRGVFFPGSIVKSLITSALVLLVVVQAGAALTSVYQFNESSGDTAGDAIRGPAGAGTLSNFGGSQWVAGKIGNAIEFDGVNDYVLALNAVPSGTTAMTVSAWVWADSAPTWGSIAKNWAGPPGSFHLGFDTSTGRIGNYLNSPFHGPLIAPSPLSLNTWHHIALTYDGAATVQTLYIDGVQVAVLGGAPADLDAIGTNMGIGVKPNDTTTGPDFYVPGYWDGKIDDLAFFNTALSPAEILTIKNNGDLGIGVVPEPGVGVLVALGVSILFRRRNN